jgi:SAM-dependent methyltransferase
VGAVVCVLRPLAAEPGLQLRQLAAALAASVSWTLPAALCVVAAATALVWATTRTARAAGGYRELDAQLLNLEQRSSWMNLGYWARTQSYPEACAALADELASVAGLRGARRVLDAGCGRGDQDLHWLQSTCAPHATVVGINYSAAEVDDACRRLAAAAASPDQRLAGAARRATIQHASATQLPFDAASFDTVVSLDAAYHFDTRRAFFAESFRVLAPGGTLALTDIVFASDPFSGERDDGERPADAGGAPPLRSRSCAAQLWRQVRRWAVGAAFSLVGFPVANAVTLSQYTSGLRAAGFVPAGAAVADAPGRAGAPSSPSLGTNREQTEEVIISSHGFAVRSVGAHVFDGFAAFIKRHRQQFGARTPWRVWPFYAAAAWAAAAAARSGSLRFIILAAVKPTTDDESRHHHAAAAAGEGKKRGRSPATRRR